MIFSQKKSRESDTMAKNIVAVNCGPRIGSNTDTLLKKAIEDHDYKVTGITD